MPEGRMLKKLTKRKELTKEQYEYIWNEWEKNKNICPICKKKGEFVTKRGFVIDGFIPFEIDHIIPISKGGKNNKKNIRIICRRCNRKKGDNF